MSNIISEKFLWRCSCGIRLKSLTSNDTCNCETIQDQKRVWMSEATCDLLDKNDNKIKALEAALWYFGNNNGPNVIDELKCHIPESIYKKLDLESIERTNGDLDD